MIPEAVVILGIPVDNLTMDQTVERIFCLVDSYQQDSRPRLVATVNVDFIVNTLTWRLGRIRHPELMDILRRADLVTADGMPLVVISKWLGNPLKERVTGADLVPRIAKTATILGKSIYFLGGRGDVAQKAADLLCRQYPGLRVAGIDSPFVYVEGQKLADSEENDLHIVGRINNAKPDILLIAFGNPKQEVWFNRNRSRLRVPVSIGIGGTFEFITGSVRRAPLWMQKSGLEWVFRITQDPRRLWKRYLVGFFKFGLMVWPAVIYYRYKRVRYGMTRSREQLGAQDQRTSALASGPLNIIALPQRLDALALEKVSENTERAFSRTPDLILDFTEVLFIDSMGLGFLIRTFRRAETSNRQFHLVGISPKTRRFFELNRTWDFFQKNAWVRLEELLNHLKAQQKLLPFYYLVNQTQGITVLELFGRLDALQTSILDMAELTFAINARNCILNLNRLDFIDSSGLIFFFKIQKYVITSGKQCVLCSLNESVNRLFRLTKLNNLFKIAPDFATALEIIGQPE